MFIAPSGLLIHSTARDAVRARDDARVTTRESQPATRPSLPLSSLFLQRSYEFLCSEDCRLRALPGAAEEQRRFGDGRRTRHLRRKRKVADGMSSHDFVTSFSHFFPFFLFLTVLNVVHDDDDDDPCTTAITSIARR